MIHRGVVCDFLRQLWWDKRNPLGIANRDVTRHNSYVSDANRNINSRQHDVFECGRINAAHIALKSLNLLNTGHVAHRTVHNQTIVALGIYGSGKIVTREGAIADLSEQIDDENVIRLEDIDYPRVFITDAS